GCADCAEVKPGGRVAAAFPDRAEMPDAAATLTKDRQRMELTALSAPAVLFTVGMIAFPVIYTIWLSFQSFSSTGKKSFAVVVFHAERLSGLGRSLFSSPFMMTPVVAGMMWLVFLGPWLGAANYTL